MFLTLFLFAVALCSTTAKDPRCEELLKPREVNQMGPGKWVLQAIGGDKEYVQATKNVRNGWMKLSSTDEANEYTVTQKLKIGDYCLVSEGQARVDDNILTTAMTRQASTSSLRSLPLETNQENVVALIGENQFGGNPVANKNIFLSALEGTEVNEETLKRFKKQGHCAGMKTRVISSDDLCPE
ncbi:hypothetical protein WMY93_004260 [Mugilogobius chulae]|uniref:Uncharacterized protein n=1 Tax=Mugilogobius chulae TaxID=88201 RepID=A0AAW0PWI1_9GOBI